MNDRNPYQVKRQIFDENQFSEVYEIPRVSPSTSQACKDHLKGKCTPSRQNFLQFIYSCLPCLQWLPKYTLRDDFLKDIAGGLTVGIMQIPQGMAYAMLTSLPPVYGLYVSFIPVVVYFIFGTSKHVSVGTFAIICLMVGEVIDNKYDEVPLAISVAQNASINGSTVILGEDFVLQQRVQVAIALSIVVGIIQTLMGFARLGFVTVFLSDPMVSGFTTGAAFQIFSSQVRHFLGIRLPGSETRGFFSLFKIYYYLFAHIEQANVGALIIGLVCTVLLFSLKYLNEKLKGKLKFPIPGELIVVVLGTGISYGAKLHRNFGVPILETVPKGIPSPTVPSVSVMRILVMEAFTIAVVAFAINVSLAKSFAKKNNYQIDSNQELIAYGLSNVIASFFSCFPSAVSLSRSLIQESLGSTQMTGIISVVLVILVLLSMAPLFEPLPKAVLAAIVLVALKGLFKQFKVLYLLWKISKMDAFVWFASFLAVFLLGVDYGLAVGLAVTLLSTVARTSRPSSSVLGQIPGTNIYRNKNKYDVKSLHGIKLFQYSSGLHYANVEHFREMLYSSTVDPRLMSTTFTKGTSSDNRMSDTDSSDTENETGCGKEEVAVTSFSPSTRKRSKSLSITPNGVSIVDINDGESADASIDCDVSAVEQTHTIIVDCSQVGYTDSMGVSALANVVTEYKRVNITVYLANCSDDVLDMLEAGGFVDVHGNSGIFLTIHDAVLFAQRRKGSQVYPDPPSLASFSARYHDSPPEGSNSTVKKLHRHSSEPTGRTAEA